MEKILDGNSAAELQNDKGDIPQSYLDRAREELADKRMDELTFNAILDAWGKIPKMSREKFLYAFKRDKIIDVQMLRIYVNKYIEPDSTEVEEYANKLINEE